MRMSCLECVRKHLGEALYHIEESFMGYPKHAMWAVGAFSHATSEALKAFPELANDIRVARLAYERCVARVLTGETILAVAPDMPDMEGLAEKVHELILAELLTGSAEKGARSVRDALGMQPKQ